MRSSSGTIGLSIQLTVVMMRITGGVERRHALGRGTRCGGPWWVELALLLAAWHLGGQSVLGANWLCPSEPEPLLKLLWITTSNGKVQESRLNWMEESWEPKKARIKHKLILPEDKHFSETLGLQRRIISLVDVQIQVFPLGEKKMMQSVWKFRVYKVVVRFRDTPLDPSPTWTVSQGVSANSSYSKTHFYFKFPFFHFQSINLW